MTFLKSVTAGTILSWFMPERLKGTGSLEERRAKLLILYSLCTANLGPIFIVVFWLTESPSMSIPMLLGTFLVLTPPFMIRHGVSILLVGNWFALQSYASLLLVCWMTGGIDPQSLVWLFYPPVVAMVFANARSGIVWTMVSVFTCVALFSLHALGVQFPQLLQSSPIIDFAGPIALIGLNAMCFLIYTHLQRFLVRSIRHQEVELDRVRREALEASRQSFRTLTENTPHGILVLQDDAVVYANPALSKLLDYDTDELPGMMLEEVLPPNAHPSVRELSGQFDSPAPVDTVVEGKCRRRDGKSLHVEIRVFAADFQGTPSVICALCDITEQKRLRAKMAHMDRMAAVGTLAAGVGHEINNPLSFVKSNAEFLQNAHKQGQFDQIGSSTSSGLDEAEFAEIVGDICDGAERIRRIVAGLRTYASEDFDEKSSQSVDLSKLLESVVKMAHSEIRHRAQLTVDLPTLPPVRGDASELGQVFLNLLLNAAQAIAPGARDDNYICIRAHNVDQTVQIELSDTGAGIPAKVQPRIFDPFFSTKAQGFEDQGMGLGLYISRNIVNSHDGQLSFESTEGEGTTFRLTLEISGEEHHLEDEPTTPLVATTDAKLLVVDDETRLLSMMKRGLAGYDVLVASSGAEALTTIEAHPDIDLVVCDLLMPEMTGMQLYEKLEEHFPPLAQRLIFITGGVSDAAMSSFVESTPHPVLDKPFKTEELRRTIEVILGETAGPLPAL